MDTDNLRRTLAQNSDEFVPEVVERVIDSLISSSDADGLPNLDFLPADLQVAVLAALYRDYISAVSTRKR